MNRVDGQRKREGAKARKRRKKALPEASGRKVTNLPEGRVETGDEIGKSLGKPSASASAYSGSKLTAEMAADLSWDRLPYAILQFDYGRSERTMAVLGMHRACACKYRATRSDREFFPGAFDKDRMNAD